MAPWHAQHQQPPTLFGQLLNYIAAPNRYGNPNFYEIHVWAWKDNPFGVFVDWNRRASCEDYVPWRGTPPGAIGGDR